MWKLTEKQNRFFFILGKHSKDSWWSHNPKQCADVFRSCVGHEQFLPELHVVHWEEESSGQLAPLPRSQWRTL